MNKLNIIAVTYNQEHVLKCFVESIISQTDPNWSMTIIHDGPGTKFISDMQRYWGEPRIRYFCTDKRYNDWGHSLRSIGLDQSDLSSLYTLHTNCDNYYTPNFVEEMCKREVVDFVYCDMIHSHLKYKLLSTSLRRGSIDCGAFIARTSFAKEVGWKSREFAADWFYISELISTYPKALVYKVDKVLMVHN